MTELVDRSASQLSGLLGSGELGARELLDACLVRIAAVNPQVNALVTATFDAARIDAAAADERHRNAMSLGPLDGLPVAHKDLFVTNAVRTTFGSPVFADFVPTEDALIVARSKFAGAVSVGKTNTPEFGAGSQTFNPVFGATLNPWDLTRTCGGSSGGAAVALACGMVPLADGSDMGGSLRNPASFCGVVGLRPSPGRVPTLPARYAWGSLGVDGPMGRCVADVALFLSCLAGPDRRAPLSIEESGETFRSVVPAALSGLRVAWSPRLGDLPVDAEVLSVAQRARILLDAAGCHVDEADPPLEDADEIFETLRAFQFEMGYGALVDRVPDQVKATVRWNVAAGRALSGPAVGRAEVLRGKLFLDMAEFFDRYDVLVTVASQVPPFPVSQEYPTMIAGQEMGSYVEWMRVCSRLTVTSCPALSLPAGLTANGLPVGIQLVTPFRSEARLLSIGLAVEELLGPLGAPPLLGLAG